MFIMAEKNLTLRSFGEMSLTLREILYPWMHLGCTLVHPCTEPTLDFLSLLKDTEHWHSISCRLTKFESIKHLKKYSRCVLYVLLIFT
jgi:hypothetical protein